MINLEQSLKVNAPAHTVYRHLAAFESYPCFVENVRRVTQTGDRHLHLEAATRSGGHQWDTEITELSPEKCIAWRNLSGPVAVGSLVLDPVSPDQTLVTAILSCRLEGEDATAESHVLSKRIQRDLARFKKFVETEDRRLAPFPAPAGESSPTSIVRPAQSEPPTVRGNSGNWTPPVEIAHGENEVIICAELPGVKREDIRIEIRDEKLTIEGERNLLGSLSKMEYRRSERPYGHFFRQIPLPSGIDAHAAAASLLDGVLEIHVPMGAGANASLFASPV